MPEDNKFSFMDDLSLLEIINLINIGIASHNSKVHVPSNLPNHNQLIPSEHLQTQKYLNDISKWTDEKQMVLNEKKTKAICNLCAVT